MDEESAVTLEDRKAAFERFWRGEGPSLLLIPPGEQELYDCADYPIRFEDPEAMWESEMARARPVADWPTDGIPTVRPNLGVIFIPATVGLPYQLKPDQMPWPGEPLDRDAIRAAREVDLAEAHLMGLAADFYALHAERGDGVAAYMADTQGVFDIAHLLYGEEIFYDIADPQHADWVAELLDISLDLYVRASHHLKTLLAEEPTRLVHGHGTSQGAWFPTAGVRFCEDTPTLLSPATIEGTLLPYVERALEPFGGGFAHFCGKHDFLFERLCHMPQVQAIDLGNPEYYDSGRLLDICGETGTVLYSRLAAADGETWEPYVRRIAALTSDAGARCILRPAVFPEGRNACQAMVDLWHELTA